MKRFVPLFVALFFFTGCESLFFYPDRTLIYHPDTCAAQPMNYLFMSSNNVMLHGWHILPAGQPPKATVMYFHGNGQNISYHIHTVWWLVNAGYAVFAVDYRGYGISGGKPDMRGILDDSRAALNFLGSGEVPEVGDIIVLGQSMGGAAAIYATATTIWQGKIVALITDSAFSSWRRIYREKAGELIITWPLQYPISWFINDEYAPVKFIAKIPDRIPIMIIQNRKDRIVPAGHSAALFEAAGGRAKLLLTDHPGHVTATQDSDIQKKILDFIVDVLEKKN